LSTGSLAGVLALAGAFSANRGKADPDRTDGGARVAGTVANGYHANEKESRSMKTVLAAIAIAAMPIAVQAAPADVAAAIAAPGRPADAVALDAGRHPVEILRFMGLKRGDRALDLFSRSGYYAEIMGRAAGPAGSVLAWTPTSFMDDPSRQQQAAIHTRNPNVSFVATPGIAFALPSVAFDFAMIHLNYHDTYYDNPRIQFHMEPVAFLATLYQAMKPGGTVAVIDHVANPGGEARDVAHAMHRIDPATIRADFARAGFVLEGESDLLRNPQDDHSKGVFDPAIRGETDRVVYRFRRPR
jgi:predicted methyltransferase